MKYMEDNKAHVRRHFPRGHVHVIEDFSENGDFVVRLEHQSRYYQTHSYTLFGIVVEVHVEDIKDCLISRAERTKLIEMLNKNALASRTSSRSCTSSCQRTRTTIPPR